MGYIIRSLIGAGLIVGLIYLVIYGSSELSGEVITLFTYHEDGLATETSLWIVDDGGRSYLRSGSPDSKWLQRIRASPDVEVVRGGAVTAYRAVIVPEMQGRVNLLMAEKYGFAETLLGWFRDVDQTVPIRLERSR